MAARVEMAARSCRDRTVQGGTCACTACKLVMGTCAPQHGPTGTMQRLDGSPASPCARSQSPLLLKQLGSHAGGRRRARAAPPRPERAELPAAPGEALRGSDQTALQGDPAAPGQPGHIARTDWPARAPREALGPVTKLQAGCTYFEACSRGGRRHGGAITAAAAAAALPVRSLSPSLTAPGSVTPSSHSCSWCSSTSRITTHAR